MNYRGSPIKRLRGRATGFTTRGILFFLLALIILVVAAVRMELAGILWGGAFSLLALYCFAANWITRSILRRYLEKNPDPLDFSLLSGQVFPGGEGRGWHPDSPQTRNSVLWRTLYRIRRETRIPGTLSTHGEARRNRFCKLGNARNSGGIERRRKHVHRERGGGKWDARNKASDYSWQ